MPKSNKGLEKKVFIYAVKKGFKPGIYWSWNSFAEQINNYEKPEFKRFDKIEEAETYFNETVQLTQEPEVPMSVPEPVEEPQTTVTENETVPEIDNTPVVVYIDGACPKNGQGASKASFGIHFPNNEHPDKYGLIPQGPFTNQRGELYAALETMKIYEKHFAPANRPLKINSDSEYTVNCLTTWCSIWERNNWKKNDNKVPANLDIIIPLYSFYKKYPKITIEWIKGHANIAGNVQADYLANQALRNCVPGQFSQ